MTAATEPVRLGIIGTGRMAQAFAAALPTARGVTLRAVASRSRENAALFAAKFGAPSACSGLDRMLEDDAVELVYIASPSAMHCEQTLRCLEAGKHVLCEKPFAINAEQAARMIRLARARDLFLMEAMWTRYVPAVVRLRDLLAEGVLGRVSLMVAGGAFMPAFDPDNYLFRPELGGGVLLDAGVYLVSWASMLFGTPRRVLATGRLGASGVDEHDAVLLDHDDGAVAQLFVSLRAKCAPEVLLAGEHGSIRVHPPLFAPRALTVRLAGAEEETITLPFEANGYQFEAEEAAACIRSGRTESKVMPLDESLAIMGTLDAIRCQIPMVYPMEA
jgi:predicted dehydrogenase